jgi:type II secretory pathway component GspD/PulD (secretin)
MQSKFKRWIVAALPLAMACTVNAQGKVTDVSTRQIDGGLAVHIGGSDLAKPSTKWDGGALVLQFQAALNAKSKTWSPKLGGIQAVSYSKHGNWVNVAVRPSSSKNPQIVKVEDGWLVFFEQSVGAIVPAYNNAPQAPATKQLAPDNLKFKPVNPRDFKSKALVTLNFVDTDIVQILKALSMQANVNVAMGPDVAGKVTINLDNVPVEEALNMVTTLGGVRYAYVNNTYIISSNARYAETMENMYGRANLASETRVIPLSSREGNQVKAAILKMVPPSTENGRYELVLPSEKLDVQQIQAVNVPSTGGKDDKTAPGNQTATMVQQKTSEDAAKKDDYIVLVGTPARMDSVELAVRGLDRQICLALGIKMTDSQATIRRIYEPKGILAQDLVKALCGDGKTDFDGVKVLATPGASSAKQAIVLSGREGDVDRVVAMLTDLDSSPAAVDTIYEVVNLKFVRPNYVWSQLMQNIPGLKASFLPPPVDPRLGVDYSEEGNVAPGGKGDNGQGAAGAAGGSTTGGASGSGGAGAAGGSGASGGSGAAGSGGSGGQLGSGGQASSGVQTSTKANTFPMKLMLRGTRDQIDAAKQYLAMVDIAPKQVAVELRVMELTQDDALKVGLDWSVLTGGTLQSIRINQGLAGSNTPGSVTGGFKFPGGGTASILGALDQITTKNNVLARPSILVNDGIATNIFVGDEVRYVKSISQSNNSGLQVVTDEVDVGVDFNVCARIGDEGNIMLDLSPTLKVLQGFTDVPGGGSLPQTSRRSAQTQMNIKSGETIAIGGLIQDQDRKVHSGIPFLKDLPLIGHLFGRTNNEKSRSEVVFFVTVKEVTESDRQGAANPRQAQRTNKDWPGNKDGKKGG